MVRVSGRMGKFRGQKRYYKRLLNNDLNIYFDRLDFNSWFDFWHDHPDWDGYGNISWKHRRQHLNALIRRFEFVKEKLRDRVDDFQTFCIIDCNDSSQDAVYIHTKNPNQDNFPVKFDRHDISIGIPFLLKEFARFSGYKWFLNEWDRDGEIIKLIYIYDENVGLSL